MTDRLATNVLLFGSQTLSATESTFTELRETILDEEDLHWIRDTVNELPSYFAALKQEIPEIWSSSAAKDLEWLADWFQTGHSRGAAAPWPNILVTPLVIIGHLTQYFRTLTNDLDKSSQQREAVGMCTGLLSAVAAASSRGEVQLQHYGGNAIRLAMLVGAVVDAQNLSGSPEDEAISISVAWGSTGSDSKVKLILKEYPEVS